jgi:hypothetical protein
MIAALALAAIGAGGGMSLETEDVRAACKARMAEREAKRVSVVDDAPAPAPEYPPDVETRQQRRALERKTAKRRLK